MNEIKFGYGPILPELEEQAKDQGFTLGSKAITLEKIRFSINMVGFHVATENQVNLMTKKLHKKVFESLKEIE